MALDTYNGTLPTNPGGGANTPTDRDNRDRLDAARRSHRDQRTEQDSLTKFLLRISSEIDAADREKRLAIIRNQIRAHQYLDGNFRGYVNSECQWVSDTKQAGEIWYQDNQIYPYLRTALMELTREQTALVVNAAPGTGDEMEAAAKFAQARLDANRDRTFNARKKQTEKAYALLNGITCRYTFFNFNGRTEKIPRIKPRGGEADPNAAAPADTDDLWGEPDTIIDYEEVRGGENEWIVPNPVGLIFKMDASCVQETPYIKWKQLIIRSVLQAKYKGIEFPSGGVESTELRYVQEQSLAGPGGFGTSGWYEAGSSGDDAGRELEPLEFHQVWLDYEVYCDKRFDEDVPLGRGRTLKKGEPLGSAFPKGLYFAHSGDIIVDRWDEDKNRKWTSSPYGLRPGSMYGSGCSIALPQQDLINDLKAIEMANAWANGVPKEFVDPARIAELSADPQIPTNVDMADGQGSIIGTAYAQAPPSPLSPEIYALEQSAKDSMQNQIGAMSNGAGGLADSQKWGDTATAISIKRDLAVGRFSPDLSLMADQLDREQAYQFLENERDFFTPKQWERLKGDHDEEAIEAFINCDIRRDLYITVVPGSYMPKSEAQMQSKFIAFAEIIPAIAQIGNPELVAEAISTFGMPESLGGWNSDKAYIGRLVKRFEALAQLFIQSNGDLPSNSLEPVPQEAIDPATGQPIVTEQPSPARIVAEQINEFARMPVDVFLDNHQAMIDALRDWRATDAGRNASNALLAAVSLRLLYHQEGIAKQQAMQTRTQQEAMAPAIEEEKRNRQEAAAAQADAEAEAAAAQEQQMLLEAANRATEFNDRDEQRAADREDREAERMHQKDLKAMELMARQREAALAAEKDSAAD